MTVDSSWTWGYFYAAPDKTGVSKLASGRKQAINVYRVDKVVPIRGQAGVELAEGATVVRIETMAKLPLPVDPARLLFQGVPQHLEYTTKEQRDDLAKRSRTDLPASKETVTVVIPIRKKAEWWAKPLDERVAHFKKAGEKIGHTAIGADYVERIYRKLYHTRYAVETTDHDFITYFEFERKHADEFRSLCAKLRDPELNPEWNWVDREYEIWMTKSE